MKQDEGIEEEDQVTGTLTGNVLKGAELLRSVGGVRWPAEHVELALVRMQRTRERRAAIARTAKLGALGALAVAAFAWFGPLRVSSRVAAVAHVAAPAVEATRVASAPVA
ncbi:MAG TPA: hypothetical protein VHJ20_00570, partial [Polyangia bacterium]|nr:hypothetical protein [Polyangia bacterium]